MKLAIVFIGCGISYFIMAMVLSYIEEHDKKIKDKEVD